ncbi:bifunctional precorrin-2 dehydrogenase/sirohydrochlorin ferrochelatase [Saccharibacillus sp. JS10]|uniref:precorrin-2 dehydrogenase/sirohydrochlorin ferrochelatase family protein n=1 Tax=Saccharibacillus sp. JS10 TaxID=2950552 RepID=UPI00210D6C99|nr:bifunctional precorrin-2 dehydrogenase/sirohydrochlorin ferrochelatase [Saccharibacillus sp. JS10]MCQ4088184.1 bifunctional precorrin-2 dehydrogenase/sirohydrochlorin ferrochelatase [Saccharibacillus sp. JS10]
MTEYMPIMLDIREMPALLIGGGRVAHRKASQLLSSGAVLTVISPKVSNEIDLWSQTGKLHWIAREATEEDVQKYRLIYLASDDESLNDRLAEVARRSGALVNVASRAKSGNFIHPAVLRRGRLVVAASTSGAGPSVASALIRELDERFGNEYETFAEFLYVMRQKIRNSIHQPHVRHELMRKLAETDILDQMRAETFVPWSEKQMDEWIQKEREE